MSTQRTPKLPGPGHPIAVKPAQQRVTVKLDDRTIADTRDAIVLSESDYPVVYYIPRADVDMSLLERSTHTSYCPYKGEASYFSISQGGRRSENAVWSYENPYSAVAEIKEYLAFYPDRVDAIDVG